MSLWFFRLLTRLPGTAMSVLPSLFLEPTIPLPHHQPKKLTATTSLSVVLAKQRYLISQMYISCPCILYNIHQCFTSPLTWVCNFLPVFSYTMCCFLLTLLSNHRILQSYNIYLYAIFVLLIYKQDNVLNNITMLNTWKVCIFVTI